MLKKPPWLRIQNTQSPNQKHVEEVLKKLDLNTVCREAKCPNSIECYSRKTATFMILGTVCTRNCSFCNVDFGPPQPVKETEPETIAQAVKELGLQYVVITSVTRDDLPDGGAKHFARVIHAIRNTSPETAVEVLIPDLNFRSLEVVAGAEPAVVGHNMETVESLYPLVRPQADYRRSLDLLKNIKEMNIRSKTGIMLGLGETKELVLALFDDLNEAGCDILTIGQYLSPSKSHFPVQKYIEPEQFDEYKKTAEDKGIIHVASAPFVRSSYHAERFVL